MYILLYYISNEELFIKVQLLFCLSYFEELSFDIKLTIKRITNYMVH